MGEQKIDLMVIIGQQQVEIYALRQALAEMEQKLAAYENKDAKGK